MKQKKMIRKRQWNTAAAVKEARKNKRLIESGLTFASQKPSDYRMR